MLQITVTLAFFSGKRNPSWTLSDSDASSLLAQLGTARMRSDGVKRFVGGLGYSGLVVSIDGQDTTWGPRVYVGGGNIDGEKVVVGAVDDRRQIERWLLGTIPTGYVNPAIVQETVQFLRDGLYHRPNCSEELPPGLASPFPPTYNPQFWNQLQSALINDSCYNYANDLRFDNSRSAKWAEPGYGFSPGAPCTTDPCGCSAYRAGARADKLESAPRPVRDPKKPSEWPVALCVGRGPYEGDSHWYRLDGNGFWSHKPGSFEARNCDESGHLIRDPRTANRWHLANGSPAYTVCGFFTSNGRVRIGTSK